MIQYARVSVKRCSPRRDAYLLVWYLSPASVSGKRSTNWKPALPMGPKSSSSSLTLAGNAEITLQGIGEGFRASRSLIYYSKLFLPGCWTCPPFRAECRKYAIGTSCAGLVMRAERPPHCPCLSDEE